MNPADFFELNDKLKLGKTFITGTPHDSSKIDIVVPNDDEVDFKQQCPMVVRWRLIDNQYVNNYMCQNCNKQDDSKYFRCSACEAAYYCSKECQKAHWCHHKIFCEDMKKIDKKGRMFHNRISSTIKYTQRIGIMDESKKSAVFKSDMKFWELSDSKDGQYVMLTSKSEKDYQEWCAKRGRDTAKENKMILECEKIFFHQNGTRWHICKKT